MSQQLIKKLPMPGKRNILITSALPYVNNTPHLGNIIGCVLSADVYSRFCRARGYNSLYICGTDEYGTSTEFKAIKENCTPREICDKYHRIHKEIYDWFQIDFDYFGRTSTDSQTKMTSHIFQKLDQNGYIEEKIEKQRYCQACEKFLADRFIEGECPNCHLQGARGDQCDSCGQTYEVTELIRPHCKTCGGATITRDSPNLFLQLPKFSEQLTQWIDSVATKGWTENTTSITKAFMRNLRSRCITRSLKWGAPVPKEGYEDKVFYVWFDAPIGYISITAEAIEDWKAWWKSEDVELCQFMGKDNIVFHTVLFPASLMGTGEPFKLVDRLSATEYLKYQGGKFSKSLNRGVFGDQARSTGIPPSVWRYYLLSIRPEASDSDFKWDELASLANGELNNSLGNLTHRVMTFIANKFEGSVPPLGDLEHGDKIYEQNVNETYGDYLEKLENIRITGAIRLAMSISNQANHYFHANKPWNTLNTNKPRCATVLNACFQTIHLLSGVFEPFIPEVCDQMSAQALMKSF